MPRQAHGKPVQAKGQTKPPRKKPVRNAAINALERAERENPDDIRIRQHRLGEVEGEDETHATRADVDERSSKRRKVTDESQEFDSEDAGSDLDGNQWHTGVADEDEDSDIDSEDAFGESDEEKFAGYTFRGSGQNDGHGSSGTSKTQRDSRGLHRSVSGYAEHDDSDHSLGEDAVDLATALDMDQEEEHRESRSAKRKARMGKPESGSYGSKPDSAVDEVNDFPSESDDQSVEDEGGSSDEESRLSVSEDSDDPETGMGLRDFVDRLETASRNIKSTDFPRPSLPDKPSTFALPSAKISAAEMLQYVQNPTHRQSLKLLNRIAAEEPQLHRKGIPGKLAAPLAKRQQDRLDRTAAYEKSKETLNRWIETVKQNRRAEHISFPLVDAAAESAVGKKRLAPVSQSAPMNDLERTVQDILHESGLEHGSNQVEDQEKEFAELQENSMTLAEVQDRRAELRKARELMFREEIRARRLKKIKSKAFRRVHRKERAKIEAQQTAQLSAAGLLNAEEEREKNDRRRAEERMGARHRESKWAKEVKSTGRAAWDEEARLGVSDLSRREDNLRRRMEGKDSKEGDTSDSASEDESLENDDTDAETERMDQQLRLLETSVVAGENQGGLSSMAFMQKAEAARRKMNDDEIAKLRHNLDIETDNASDDEANQADSGRQKYGPKGSVNAQHKATPIVRREFEEKISDDEEVMSFEEETSQAERKSGQLHAPAKAVMSSQAPPRQKSTQLSGSSQPLRQPANSRTQITPLDDYTSPSESEENIADPADGEDPKAALAAAIFAGPSDEVAEFNKEKEKVVKEEGDQVIDNGLPGWGSWTGAGISKQEQKRGKGKFVTTVKGVAPEKRQDVRLDRVIINEKRVKKTSKYLATELPHPFETRQQYERSLRLPVGPEWSTRNHFQESIKPRVLLKQGTVIKPIARPLA